MPGLCAHPSAPPAQSPGQPGVHSARRVVQAAFIILAGLVACAGCANSNPNPSSTIQPEPTGNPEMDRMLSMLRQLDEMEDDAIDLATLAAETSRQTPAESAPQVDSSPVASNPIAGPAADQATDRAEALPAESDGVGDQADDVPATAMTEADSSLPDIYAHPFAANSPFGDVDPFETQLALLNAPAGLLTPDADDASEPDQPDGPSHAALARRLADEIRDQGSQGEPFADALVLAAISPLVGLAPEMDPSLTSEAIEITDAVYELFADLSSLGSDPDPDQAAAIARAFSDSLGQSRPLEITTAVLCTRVDGFGRYRQVSDTPPKFLSGTTSRTVVYVEIDHFAHAPVTSNYRGPERAQAPQWQVRLSQEINLYRANETVAVWSLPESNLSDISRNKRRDFHVTRQITLPATLALGMYKLKITMRDLVSGAVAEKTIAIQIVNDAGLLSSN